MKVELTLVLESTNKAFGTLESLKKEGYNATVMSSDSLRHAVDYYPGEHHFINLRHLEERQSLESVLCVFVVEEDKLNHLKEVVRNCTNNFKDLKGFMYSRPINDYEGSI